MVPSTRRNPTSSHDSTRFELATPPPPDLRYPEVESVPDQPGSPVDRGIQIGEITDEPNAGDTTELDIADLEAKKRGIERLEEFLAVHTRLKELTAQVSRIHAEDLSNNPFAIHGRTEVKKYKKVEGFEVDKFKRSFSIQERGNWLSQLGYVFRGNPGVYEDEEMKILAGVKYLDTDCKNDWIAEERCLEDNNDERLGS